MVKGIVECVALLFMIAIYCNELQSQSELPVFAPADV
jgi:hypothetical protein